MLFGETVAVYCENHTEHTDTLCGQNVEFCYVNSVRTSQETHYVLRPLTSTKYWGRKWYTYISTPSHFLAYFPYF
jgi:hypothetical protein